MSRSSSLRQSLQLSPNHSLEVLSIEASGDCFYDCVHALITKGDEAGRFSNSPLFRRKNNESSSSTPSPQTMRDYVADQMTSEQFDSYQMYAQAGVDEYTWMLRNDAPKNLQEMRDFARRSGKEYGPGKCLWADEFSLRKISDGLHLTILILDDQVQRGMGSMKRKRGDSDGIQADGRFVSIGNYNRAVILHRSRREHYNGVIIGGSHTFDIRDSPVSALWPTVVTNTQNDNKELKNKKCVSDNKPKKESIGKFYCGCAGFSNSNWVGNFYPKNIVGHNSDRQLNHYQEHFSTVELNSTFYGMPLESTVLKWKRLCSKSFQLVAKAPKGVTHEHETLNDSALVCFLSRMKPLKEILACVLIQCPRTLIVDVSQLHQMKISLEQGARWYSGHLAFEFRNRTTFYNTSIRKFIAQNKWTFVVHPDSLERSTIGTSVHGRGLADLVQYEPQPLSQFAFTCSLSSDSRIVYVRLHGTNDEHRGEYNVIQLKEISEQVHNWRMEGLDVYCFFLNDLEPSSLTPSPKCCADHSEKWPAMPKNAKQLEKLVFDLANEQIPSAPKKPKATLQNFFTKK